MRTVLLHLFLLFFISCEKGRVAADTSKFKDGDLIFQTSMSSQSKAVQFATESKYSHCGIIYSEGNEFYVFEAIQPVKTTPLEE